MNFLRPYPKWEAFRDEAVARWNTYRSIAGPLRVSRLALRYINRIELPLPLGDFKEYLRTTPEIAPELPQGLSEFLLRLVIPCPEFKSTAIITETLDAPSNDRLPWILDIDVFQDSPPLTCADDIWTVFDQLRELKNRMFFHSLTEKALNLLR